MEQALKTYELSGRFPAANQLIISDQPLVPVEGMYYIGDKYATPMYYNTLGTSGAYVSVAISSLQGIEGYTDLANQPINYGLFTNGGNNKITVAMRIDENGIVEYNCGALDPGYLGYMEIPLSNMPSTCTCANLTSWAAGGSC